MVTSMSKVGDVLADSMEVGAPPVVISMPTMAMDVRKDRSEKLVKEKVESDIGGCKIDGSLAVDDGSCVAAQVKCGLLLVTRRTEQFGYVTVRTTTTAIIIIIYINFICQHKNKTDCNTTEYSMVKYIEQDRERHRNALTSGLNKIEISVKLNRYVDYIFTRKQTFNHQS